MRRIETGIISFLLLCSVCFGADSNVYVCTTSGASGGIAYTNAGSDGGAGTETNPFATIGKALETHGSDTPGTDTITIWVKAGDTLADARILVDDGGTGQNGYDFVIRSSIAGTKWTQVTSAGVSSTWWIKIFGPTSGSIQFIDMSITRTGALTADITYTTDDGMDFIFTDCVMINTSATGEGILGVTDAGSAARNITLNNTSMTYVDTAIHLNGADVVIIENGCTITNTGAVQAVQLHGIVDEFYVDASTITSDVNTAIKTDVSGALLTSNNIFVVRNGSTISGLVGIQIEQLVKRLILTDSTFLAPLNIAGAAIKLGDAVEGNVTGANSGNALGQINIRNNTITATYTRALHLQFGCNGASILNNRISGDDHSLHIMSDGCEIAYNISTGDLPMFIMGNYNNVHNNTVRDDGNACLLTLPLGAGFNDFKYPTGNTIINNIFVTTGASKFAYTDKDGNGGDDNQDRGEQNDEMSDYVDYNCYYNAGGGDAFSIGEFGDEQTGNTIALMQAAWQTATSGGTAWNVINQNVNDQHSIIADPLFKNTTTFELNDGSPCLGNGFNGETMGAKSPNVIRPSGRYDFRTLYD